MSRESWLLLTAFDELRFCLRLLGTQEVCHSSQASTNLGFRQHAALDLLLRLLEGLAHGSTTAPGADALLAVVAVDAAVAHDLLRQEAPRLGHHLQGQHACQWAEPVAYAGNTRPILLSVPSSRVLAGFASPYTHGASKAILPASRGLDIMLYGIKVCIEVRPPVVAA